MCNNRKPNGKRCKTINVITRQQSGENEGQKDAKIYHEATHER